MAKKIKYLRLVSFDSNLLIEHDLNNYKTDSSCKIVVKH